MRVVVIEIGAKLAFGSNRGCKTACWTNSNLSPSATLGLYLQMSLRCMQRRHLSLDSSHYSIKKHELPAIIFEARCFCSRITTYLDSAHFAVDTTTTRLPVGLSTSKVSHQIWLSTWVGLENVIAVGCVNHVANACRKSSSRTISRILVHSRVFHDEFES